MAWRMTAVAGRAEEEFLWAPLHGWKLGEARVQLGVVERGRMELLIEPFVQAHGADGFEVARAGAKGEAIESVKNAVVALDPGGAIGGARGVVGGGLRHGGGAGGDETEAERDCQ